MKNSRSPPHLVATLALLSSAQLPSGYAAEPVDAAGSIQLKLSEALANGRLLLEVRPRYARISESLKPDETDVWTVRTTLGWQTAPFANMRLMAQYSMPSMADLSCAS